MKKIWKTEEHLCLGSWPCLWLHPQVCCHSKPARTTHLAYFCLSVVSAFLLHMWSYLNIRLKALVKYPNWFPLDILKFCFRDFYKIWSIQIFCVIILLTTVHSFLQRMPKTSILYPVLPTLVTIALLWNVLVTDAESFNYYAVSFIDFNCVTVRGKITLSMSMIAHILKSSYKSNLYLLRSIQESNSLPSNLGLTSIVITLLIVITEFPPRFLSSSHLQDFYFN